MSGWIDGINWSDIFLEIGIIVLKLIFIMIGYMIVKSIGSRAISKGFNKSSKRISQGRAHTLQGLVINIYTYFLLFIAIGIIFEIFGLDIKALLAGAGIIGLAIGFGAQGLVSDVVTGFFILLEKQFDVGDYVTAGGVDGIVEEIGLRTTKIRGFDGTLHFIPNRSIASVSNHSRGNMRALVDIAIPYDEDVNKAIDIIQDVSDKLAQENDSIVEVPRVIGVQELGSSKIVLRIIGKTKNNMQEDVEMQLRKAIKEAFDKNSIVIP